MDVTASGRGAVTVVVDVGSSTAAALEDFRAGLPVADLRRAGWQVQGPAREPGGLTVLSARHRFSSLSQVPDLVADIAGSGPPAKRPFRLVVEEDKSSLNDKFVASGTVDLRCSLSCFDDPRLAASVGNPLGLPPGELRQLLGPSPARELQFGFEVSLPGRATASDARYRKGRDVFVWPVKLGGSAPMDASTVEVNTAFLRDLVVAVSAGALVVLLTAAWLVSRHRRGSAHRRGRGRGPGSNGPGDNNQALGLSRSAARR